MPWKFSDGLGQNNNYVSHLGGITGGVQGAVGIYSSDTVQHFPLGHKIEFDDGRCFRYCHFVSAVGAGKLAAVDASVSIQTSFDAAFTDSAGTATDYASGQSTIYLKTTDFTSDDAADVFADGFLHITDEGGEGYTYKIKSNGAGADTAANVLRLDLYDVTQTALDSEDSCSITGSKWRNLAIANNGTDDVIAGVTFVTQAAADFGFVQTRGIATILADESAGTIAAGTIATLSDGVNGAAQPMGGASFNSEDDIALSLVTEPIIGTFLTAAVDTEYVAIDLCLE